MVTGFYILGFHIFSMTYCLSYCSNSKQDPVSHREEKWNGRCRALLDRACWLPLYLRLGSHFLLENFCVHHSVEKEFHPISIRRQNFLTQKIKNFFFSNISKNMYLITLPALQRKFSDLVLAAQKNLDVLSPSVKMCLPRALDRLLKVSRQGKDQIPGGKDVGLECLQDSYQGVFHLTLLVSVHDSPSDAVVTLTHVLRCHLQGLRSNMVFPLVHVPLDLGSQVPW